MTDKFDFLLMVEMIKSIRIDVSGLKGWRDDRGEEMIAIRHHRHTVQGKSITFTGGWARWKQAWNGLKNASILSPNWRNDHASG
ncbi:MAG: hypothetical protein ACR2PF_16750 [Rhizobiaceae bacterium]